MVPVMSLWLPIVLSAIIVFFVSAFFHMVLPLHKNDMKRVPKEDELLEALRRLDIPPGDYGAPLPGSSAGMKDPAFVEKMKKGPMVFMTIAPGGDMGLGKSLTLWFIYSVLISFFSAYITGRALAAGVDYLQVFRFVGATAFMGYSFALVHDSIWYRRNWGTTLLSMFDGLIYGLLTAGTFGWLWPR